MGVPATGANQAFGTVDAVTQGSPGDPGGCPWRAPGGDSLNESCCSVVREVGLVERFLTGHMSRPRVPLPVRAARQGKTPASEDSQAAGCDRAMAMHTAMLANSKLIFPLALISTWLKDNTSLN